MGKPAARLMDPTAHGGMITGPGCPTVLIGSSGAGGGGGGSNATDQKAKTTSGQAPKTRGALNQKRNPKPSIAKTIAEFCNVATYGAKSGSHIEVKDGNTWISSTEYKNKHGNYPSGTLPHRLEPDSGGYIAHNP